MLELEQNDDLFLGRAEEQKLFRQALEAVLKRRIWLSRLLRQNQFEWVTIFLLYGNGGMGKSRLAHRFRQIVTDEKPYAGHFRTIWLDWEQRKNLDSSLMIRESVSPETVFRHIYSEFRDLGFESHFSDYEEALSQRQEVEQKVNGALNQSGEPDENAKKITRFRGKGYCGDYPLWYGCPIKCN
ncbi:MAG: ATP-binding protein [Chloroflexi bacterium]|nr:ATP-binding protein [Chloroflexota bacterium]